MVLTAYSVLSPAIGLIVTVVGAMRKHCRKLDASVETSGPHGFAVHLQRARLARQSGHRIPRPTFVTIAKRPSWRARDAPRSASDLPDATSTFLRGLARPGKSGHFVPPPCGKGQEALHPRRWRDLSPQAGRGEEDLTLPAESAAARFPGTPPAPRSARRDRRATDDARDRREMDALRW